jgi:hypothetical protein
MAKNYYYLLPQASYYHGPVKANNSEDVKHNIKKFFNMRAVPEGTQIWEEGQTPPNPFWVKSQNK